LKEYDVRLEWSDFMALNETNTDEVPTQAGIYLLWAKQMGNTWRVFYVGKAPSLRMTLKGHITWKEPNAQLARKLRNCVTGFECSVLADAGARDGVLKFLVEHYQPELYAQPDADPTEPITVNLP
jgi:excinuclease UvrABC nuclease subunit